MKTERIIETKYLYYTDRRGPRIKARSMDVSITIPDPAYSDDLDNHKAAADALIKKLDWKFEHIGGGHTPKGYAFLYRSND